eukprot:scaffold203980_cov28-Tisochrysis_lutea.AAC.1
MSFSVRTTARTADGATRATWAHPPMRSTRPTPGLHHLAICSACRLLSASDALALFAFARPSASRANDTVRRLLRDMSLRPGTQKYTTPTRVAQDESSWKMSAGTLGRRIGKIRGGWVRNRPSS